MTLDDLGMTLKIKAANSGPYLISNTTLNTVLDRASKELQNEPKITQICQVEAISQAFKAFS